MASILCSKCNTGIHYHSEPQGIEYYFIKQDDWKEICQSKFNPDKKEMNHTRYPRLYRTDTLEDDFAKSIVKMWKCPNCGTFMLFDNRGNVTKTYEESNVSFVGESIFEGIYFDDYLWDQITNASKPDISLHGQKPSGFFKLYEKGLILSLDESFEKYCRYTEHS